MSQTSAPATPSANPENKAAAESFSPRALRDAFGTFATGVTVITAVRPDGEPVGITANSFTSVSLSPPLVLWCIASESQSVSAFAKGADFAVTVVGERDKKLALHFASRTAVKFPSGAVPGPHGPSPVIPGSHPCRLDCVVQDLHPAGDHWIVVGLVKAIDRRGGAPLAFHDGRFGKVRPEGNASPMNPWAGLSAEPPAIFEEPFP